jgi:N-methylhydantoinase A
MPSVAVHTVGAGGGSIGWLDPGGALRVGPQSAGAHPGPACYRRGGTHPTVTDAHVVLGRIDPDGRLAGSVGLDAGAATAVLAALGGAAGLEAVEAALGMVEVVEARMERAIRAVSVEEGADPRSAALVAFGGAGGLHATALARRLEMAGVVVPPWAGVFSAIGLLLAPPRQDRARSVLVGEGGAERLDHVLAAVAEEAEAALRTDTGSAPERVETTVDVRYRGQSHETAVAYRPGDGWRRLAEGFHRAHAERNGFARPDDPIEAVTVRAAAVGRAALGWRDLPEHRPHGDKRRGLRMVRTPGGPVEAAVWRRAGMTAGDEVTGPAVVEETESTIWLAPGERAVLHPSGALEVEW